MRLRSGLLLILSLFIVKAYSQRDFNTPTFDYTSHLKDESLHRLKIGGVRFPSGKIITGDPFFIFDSKPFRRSIEPGTYGIELILSKIEEDHYRVAFARLIVKEEVAVKWELAIAEGISDDAIKKLGEDEIFGFPVDAGLGCFIDVETNKLYNSKLDEVYKNDPSTNYYDEILAEEFKAFSSTHKYSNDVGDWNIHFLDEEKSYAVPMFSSGWGDGYYPTYWGLNQNNEIVELIIDFAVITEQDD